MNVVWNLGIILLAGGVWADAKPKSDLKLDLTLTLDVSSSTGNLAFNQAKQFILCILRTYNLGPSSLRIKLVYAAGDDVRTFTFDNEADVAEYSRIINDLDYTGAESNVMAILLEINKFFLTFTRDDAKRSILLIGGFPVADQEVETQVTLLLQFISDVIPVSYMAIGEETGRETFWAGMARSMPNVKFVDLPTTDAAGVASVLERGRRLARNAGPQRTKKTTNLQLILTLDGSTASGKRSYFQMIRTMLLLLREYNLGPSGLQLFVVHYNGEQPKVIKFKTKPDIKANYVFMTKPDFYVYGGVTPNTAAILEKVEETVASDFSNDRPRVVWLLGGLKVNNTEGEIRTILSHLQTELNVNVFYFTTGVDNDVSFWRTVLADEYIRPAFIAEPADILNLVNDVLRVVENVEDEPTTTTSAQELTNEE